MLAPLSALGFTQNALKGGGTPPGHDYLTIKAALEVMDGRRPEGARIVRAFDTSVPAGYVKFLKTPGGLRSDPDFGYGLYDNVISTVYGQRWVDIAGTNVIAQGTCFNGIAQDPDELQHDHFLRQRDETGLDGGKRAISASVQRFRDYFVAAATADARKAGRITFLDGGLRVGTPKSADRNFFLFGRALHLFQDSFSPEHAVRTGDWQRVVAIKTYICTLNAEMHTPNKPLTAFFDAADRDDDIIWHDPRVTDFKTLTNESNLVTSGRVGIEATKDLWAAFLRTMNVGTPVSAERRKKAEDEADKLIKNWLQIDEDAMRARYKLVTGAPAKYRFIATKAVQQDTCQKGATDADYMGGKVSAQRKCAFSAMQAGKNSERDPILHVPYVFTLPPVLSTPPANFLVGGGFASSPIPRPAGSTAANPPATAPPDQQHANAPAEPAPATHAPTVKLLAAGKLYQSASQSSVSSAIKKGAELSVLSGRKNPRADKTYEWCEVQAGTGPKRWIACLALPAAFRKDAAQQHEPSGPPIVRLLSAATVYDQASKAAKPHPVESGSYVKVLAGRKNKRADKTYDWCEVQVGTDPRRWISCTALPASFRK